MLRAAAALCAAALALAAGGAGAQALRIVEVRVQGQPASAPVVITQFVPPQRNPVPLPVSRGQELAEGVEIGVPARVVLVLVTANGNRIELSPDTRFTVLRVGATGEVHQVLEGSARFDVERALSFFNVEFNRFVALVRGTTFEVQALPGGAGAAQVQSGRVAVQRDVPTLMADTARAVDMVEHDQLDARTRQAQAWPAQEPLRRYTHSSEAMALYTAELRAAQGTADRDRQLAALNNIGLTWLARGIPAEATGAFNQMLALTRDGRDEPWRARALNNLGAAALEAGNDKAAVDHLQAALASNRSLAPHTTQRRMAQVWGNLGLAWRRLGELQKARDATLASLETHRTLAAGADSAAVARNLEALGQLEATPAAAMPWHQQALAMRQRLYGDTPHPELANSHINLGVNAARAGDDAGAAAHYAQAVALRERLLGGMAHGLLAQALVQHGGALCRSGDTAGGLVPLERALAMRQALNPAPRDKDVADSLRQIAACWASAAGRGEALAQQRMTEALQRSRAYEAPPRPGY